MNLKAYCKSKKIKQVAVIKATGIKKDRLSHLYNGKPVNFGIIELMTLCKYLDVKPSELTENYKVLMNNKKFCLKEKAPQGCANIEGLKQISNNSIPQLGESMEDNTQTLHQIVDMLQGVPKHQWGALVIEVNREYERNANKVMLTDVSGVKKLLTNNL